MNSRCVNQRKDVYPLEKFHGGLHARNSCGTAGTRKATAKLRAFSPTTATSRKAHREEAFSANLGDSAAAVGIIQR